MAKIGDIVFTGASGTKYDFAVYPLDTAFNNIGVVYIFSKRTVKEGKKTHDVLYVGQTSELKNRLVKHEKWTCAKMLNVNCICIHRDNNESSRLDKETDLRQKYDPPCNKQ